MPETTLEERIAGLEGSYKELTKRIDDLRSETHRGFDGIRAELNAQRAELQAHRKETKAEMAELRSEMLSELRSSFRWTMGVVLVNWLSLLAAIFLVAAKR